jgi:hypothetical protein
MTKVQRIIGIVERLRLPARHCFAQALAGGRSPGPVLAYGLSSLIQDHSARAGSKRLTINVIRNQSPISLAGQQRNRMTLDETNIASPQIIEFDFSRLIGLRQSFTSNFG